jgi:hypothetical protein
MDANDDVILFRRVTFWKMGQAYDWFVGYIKPILKNNPNLDFLWVVNGVPALSTAAWNSETTKIMIGKAFRDQVLSSSQISNVKPFGGNYMLLMNRKTRAISVESYDANGESDFKKKTRGDNAEYWGVMFNKNSRIVMWSSDDSNKGMSGENWAYWFVTEYIMTEMKVWTTIVQNESQA